MTTQNAVNTTLSGQSGTGAFAGTTAPVFTGISFTTNTGITGTATNDNVVAGDVGEFITSVIDVGTPVSLTTGTPTNLTSISLTPGDWDVGGNITFLPTSTTSLNYLIAWASETSASLPAAQNYVGHGYTVAGTVTGAFNVGFSLSPNRVSIAVTTTLYLSCQAGFSASTLSACGQIVARRRR